MNFGRRFKPCECEVDISGISVEWMQIKRYRVRHETVGLTKQFKLISLRNTSGAEAELSVHERRIGVRTLGVEALFRRAGRNETVETSRG